MHTATPLASSASCAASHAQLPSSAQQQVTQPPQEPMVPQLRSEAARAEAPLLSIAKSTERNKHLAWAKERALDYVNRGDLQSAVASMVSDLTQHPEIDVFKRAPQLALIGLRAATNHDTDGVRRWIEGFR